MYNDASLSPRLQIHMWIWSLGPRVEQRQNVYYRGQTQLIPQEFYFDDDASYLDQLRNNFTQIEHGL